MQKSGGFLETLFHFRNYFTANLVTKALGFLSIPVLTRLLVPSDYGVVSVYNSYIALLSVVLTLNLHASVGRYFYEQKEDFNRFFGATVILTAGVIIVTSIVFFMLREGIAGVFNLPLQVILLMIPMVVFSISDSMFNQVFQPLRRSKQIAIVMMIKAYAGFGLSVVIILLLRRRLYLGPILGAIAIGFVFFIYFTIRLREYFKLSFDRGHLRYILHYSIPLIPYTLSGYILAQFDRIMINSYRGAGDAGLYSLAYNIGMLLSVVIGSLNTAWMPKYFEYMNNRQYVEHDRDVDRIFRIVLVVALGLVMFGREIGLLLARRDYHVSLSIVPVVVIGYIFYGVFTVYSRNIGYAKKTVYSSIVLLVSGAANVALNALFIPRYGYAAAAYTTVASYLLMAVLAWIVNRFALKLHSTPPKVILIPLLLIIPFIACFYGIEKLSSSMYITLTVKAVLLAVWVFVLLFRYRGDIISFMRKR